MSFEYSTSDLKENEDPHTLQDYGFLQIFEFFFFFVTHYKLHNS